MPLEQTSLFIEILKSHGLPTFIMLVAIAVYVKWHLPRIQKRDEEDAKHRAALVQEMAEIREKNAEREAERDKQHLQEMREMREEHRKDRADTMQAVREMINQFSAAQSASTSEIRRVGGLVISLGESMGKDKNDIVSRASQISGVTLDPKMFETRPGV